MAESTVVTRGCAYMVTMTVPMPGSESNVSKSGAMRLMPIMIPSTGNAAIRRVASASENSSVLDISTSVMAQLCSRAALAMPSIIERLPNLVTSLTHRPTEW